MRIMRAMDGLYYWFNDLGLDNDTSAIFAFLLFLMLFVFIIILINTIFTIITKWILFKKCGEPGWKAIIPVYNEITLLKLSGLNWWWIFLIYAASIYSIILSPIQTMVIATESVAGSMLSIILSFISIIFSITTIVSKINEYSNLAKKFNKSAGYSVLFLFFEPIMNLVFGLSNSFVYDKSVNVSNNGFFGNKK